jgi:hypothetical protein
MNNNIIYGLIFFAILYYFLKKKKKLTPEEIAAIEVERLEKEEERKKAEAIKEEERKKAEAIQEEKRKERARIKAEEEAKILNEMLTSTHRVYFSYSLVNEDSHIYLVHPNTNIVIDSSETSLKKLYVDGWRLLDIDKTGKSAQLEDFNFIVRLSKN